MSARGKVAKVATTAAAAKTVKDGVDTATRERGSLRLSGLLSLAWGAVVLGRGPELFSLVQGRESEPLDDAAMGVLGARYLAQGTVQVIAPRMFGPLYAVIDGLHAASMVALAITQPSRRRAALLSGGVAAIACAAAVRASSNGSRS